MFSVCWEQDKNNTMLFLASSLLLFVFMYLLNISVFRISLIFISCCPSCCFLFPSFPYFYFATSHPFSTLLSSPSSSVHYSPCCVFPLHALCFFHSSFILPFFSSACPLFLCVLHSLHLSASPPSFVTVIHLVASLSFFLLLPCSPTCWLAHSLIDSVDDVTSMPSG